MFHDESTFQANEDQPTLWAKKGTSAMSQKNKKLQYLMNTTDIYSWQMKENDPMIHKLAQQLLEYSKAR